MLRMSHRTKTNTLDLTLLACTGIILTLILLSAIVLVGTRVFATETSSSLASVMVSSTCQLDSVNNQAHQATVNPSTYRDNIGKTTISTLCNDNSGYAIYTIGYTNTEFGRNDMLGTETGRTINTGTATSGLESNWAMKLTAVTGTHTPTIITGFSDYHAIPNEYTKTVSYPSSTGISVSSDFEMTYATFVAGNQPPDTYVGKVQYTLVHPSDSTDKPCAGKYFIAYNSNGGSGTMDSQEACIDDGIALHPNGFTLPSPVAENQFAVWNTAADGSGHSYHGGQTVTNIGAVGETVTLYAQWAPKYIQDLTPAICNVAAKDDPFTVYDRRDGKDYTVRYVNGACWMTQNLRATGTLNAQYSNFSSKENFNPCTGDLATGNSVDEARCHDSGDEDYGVWYNFAAASAGSIIGETNTSDSTEDICPSGWSLPSAPSYSYYNDPPAGSIYSLIDHKAEFDPVVGGYYHDGVHSLETNGYWWSSRASDSQSHYFLNYNGADLYTNYNRRYDGNYIRCMRL